MLKSRVWFLFFGVFGFSDYMEKIVVDWVVGIFLLSLCSQFFLYMPNTNLKGLGVALITPFTKEGSIDFDALAKLVDFQLSNGTNYLVVLGTTAETPTLSATERQQIVHFVAQQVQGRVPVVAGIGGNCTAEVMDTLNTFDLSGVSAILSVAPYYNKPSQEGLYRHFRAISAVSPLPIILYNVPGRTGVNITAETTLRIAHDCSNVIAIKEASGDLEQMKQILLQAPDQFSLISGDDSVTTAVIEMGGIGVISVFGNAFPKEMAWLVDNAFKGYAREAAKVMDNKYDELFRLMFVEGNPAGIKCMLHLRGVVENVLRLPLTPVSEETQRLIEAELNHLRF